MQLLPQWHLPVSAQLQPDMLIVWCDGGLVVLQLTESLFARVMLNGVSFGFCKLGMDGGGKRSGWFK